MRNDLTEKLQYNAHIKPYLLALSHLAKRDVIASELLPREALDLVNAKKKPISKAILKNFTISFNDKKSTKFRAFINDLYELNSNPVYVWTKPATYCGLFKSHSIQSIDFSFDFSFDKNGVIDITSDDFTDHLELNWYEDIDRTRKLEIQIRGEHWPFVSSGPI